MAKKKGGKKKGGKKKSAGKKSVSNKQKVKPEPVDESAVIEESEVIIEEPVEEVIEETMPEEEPESVEPELSDAVAEVLGSSKEEKKEKKIPKKYKTALLKYQTDGLDTAELEDLMENASVKKIREGFRAFEEGLGRLAEIKTALENMEITGLDSEVEELTQLLSNPKNHEEATARFEELKFKQKATAIHKELDEMVLPAMKERV